MMKADSEISQIYESKAYLCVLVTGLLRTLSGFERELRGALAFLVGGKPHSALFEGGETERGLRPPMGIQQVVRTQGIPVRALQAPRIVMLRRQQRLRLIRVPGRMIMGM